MQCFYHRDASAVGLCKSCGRGICGDCTVPYAEGLACRGQCEQAVTDLIALIDRNRRAVVGSGRAVYMFPLFFLVAGVVFAGAGAMTPGGSLFALTMGGIFIVLGLAHGLWIRRVQRGE